MVPSRLTNAQRLEVCKHKAKHQRMSQGDLAAWTSQKFGVEITQSSISLILRKRRMLEAMTDVELSAKRPRVAHHPQLDEALSIWVLQC
ncbi:hypothetical protein BASA60_006941 [Batrachochytrium salamandrivorans]|nr:hypothetical protein BASA60_006941 [Batrachochytrium salamandrivorans]KAH9268376.1 hypothetical protein BASA83_009374 [Batrachochytrium salamandrivorans]